MKKKIVSLSLVLMMLISLVPNSIYAEEQPIKLIINGQEIQTNSSPIIENNRTLVPIRVIAENFGCNVDWYEDSKSILISKLSVNTANFKNFKDSTYMQYFFLLVIGEKYVFVPDIYYINERFNQQVDFGYSGISNNNVVKNTDKIPIDVAPKIINGTTYVPIRVISKQLGLNVNWDDTTRTVIVTE